MRFALESLFKRIDDLRDDVVSLTQDLVRIPTVNPPGDAYTPCAELMGERLRKAGFDVVYERGVGTPGDSDKHPRTNIVARIQGSRPGPCVHFNGHIDVVEPGEGWTKDPYGAELEDGKIYGRGTCDMKGGIASAMVAVEAILQEGLDFPGAIEISGTVDEETGGYGGVAYLAEKGFFSRPRVDHVIIPEPLNVDRVCIGHRGVWWAEVKTHGHIAHGSMPFLGDCAVRHMGAFLNALETELYPALENRHTEMPVVPEGAKQSTLNIASMHGGLPDNFNGLPSSLVPDLCSMILDRRFLIEEPLDQVKGEILAILDRLTKTRDGFRYDVRDIMEFEPTLTDENAPVVRAVAEEIERQFGRPAETICSPGTYDQKHIFRIGQLKDCIAYGPGILDLAHQPDEYIEVDAMVTSMKVMASATLKLLNENA
ncbi:acetylornithine deacetylase/succinyl-diaminopimelate desuccinylase family protein [Hwanghaeella grinnelliae]|uniref:Acetylornithine deacetylase/succinyl-diaminopimelate desuccinylase family protein n=1 Tax=Hwanghaeella grinnelliae TaxID=2500179 RepID=A0A437QJH5_9PROT|nr:acetylornithine deacetylase/succinyl-diaminopimelate desuccinylase family protein [Hwanghaeella grinnelliae]RVU34659.1 acetylornithine deacetylase/succinyl-diaminopimelate desuccinylase family protein [Hwanghaeella grinnelliae]